MSALNNPLSPNRPASINRCRVRSHHAVCRRGGGGLSGLAIDAGIERCFGVSFRHVELAVGSRVDQRLAQEGALAMALNQSTVLLSSCLAGAPPELRRLVIAHELAHVIQHSHPGAGPEEELEAEAWEAARNVVLGVPFHVRGAANRPLAAKAIIAIGGALDAAAMAHYSQFQAERLLAAGAIAVSSPKIVTPVTWDSVLDEIIGGMAGNADKSFVLCAHGNQKGMIMPLVGGTKFAANTQSLEFLMSPAATTTTMLKSVGGATPPDSTQIAALVAKMQAVRKLKIAYVEFRGCSMGADMKNLEVLREFLGCTSVSAPDVKSSWAIVRPNIVRATRFDAWVKATKGVKVSVYPPGRCGVLLDWGMGKFFFAAEANAVVPFWLKDHFFRNPPFASQPAFEGWMANFGLHGLHLTPVALPMDPDYASHIKRVISTPTGLVRM